MQGKLHLFRVIFAQMKKFHMKVWQVLFEYLLFISRQVKKSPKFILGYVPPLLADGGALYTFANVLGLYDLSDNV